MQRPRVTTLLTAALVAVVAAAAPAAAQESGAGPIVVTGGDFSGYVDTTVRVAARPGGESGGGTRPVGAGSGGGGGAEGPTCTYQENQVPAAEIRPGGAWYNVSCSDGRLDFVWLPSTAPQAAAPVVTSAQLALEMQDRLPLAQPTIQRSPDETIRFKGDPMTWVNLWTWFWTDPATYQPMTQTVSAGAVSATVTATPVGLLFDPGDGSPAVRCAGPGRAWVERDDDAAPPGGCGYRYRSVTDGTITSTVSILWDVSWTGTGGLSGSLSQMRTQASAPLRVMQTQVVNG